ncbi:plasmid replication protein RepC [Rhizobium sp. A22-96]
MESGYVTTPFGRRSMSLGMLANQQLSNVIEHGTVRNKWKLFRAACEARASLGVTERSLTVLDALLTFYPNEDLSQDAGLIVFPSNAQLSIRARGMTAATLRRHLAVLVEAGLIVRRDSPNGKRYAHRSKEGQVKEAFGFSLSPLLARAAEIERLAAQVSAERALFREAKEHLTLCRRDVAKLIAVAIDERVPGDWDDVHGIFRTIVERVPRVPSLSALNDALRELSILREEIVNRLEIQIKTRKIDAKESQNERHIQSSDTKIILESEPRIEKVTDGPASAQLKQADQTDRPKADKPTSGARNDGTTAGEVRTSSCPPLDLVIRACPQIADYGPGGSITNWRDLKQAALIISSILRVSPSAYQEATTVMGPENAATVMACILERGGQINSAGGYLRDLTRKAENGEFGPGPMLMALAKVNGSLRKRHEAV